MKLKLGILAILFSTSTLIALVYVAIESIPAKTQALKAPKSSRGSKALGESQKPEQPAAKKKWQTALPKTSPDALIIKEISTLSNSALEQEFLELGQRLEQEKSMEKLELGLLEPQEALKTKSMLERYTLLSLESTRRKYLPIEPELKDALFAHRDSLKDIREILSHY